MKPKFVVARLLVAAAFVALPAASWAQGASLLRYCSTGSPKTFDPANSDSGVDHRATDQIFSQLVEYKRGTDELTPALAERWTVSPDGLQYTFDLRKGVQFQTTEDFKPTRELNADDVLFTFGRLLNRDSAFGKALPIVSPYVVSYGWEKLIAKVEKLSPTQVRFTLAQRDAAFLSALTGSFASIQSAEYGAQLLKSGKPERIAMAPVGTGPFQLKSFRVDSQLRLIKHPGWFRATERPRVDTLVFAITPDGNVRAQRLKRDECDIADPVAPADLAELRKDPAIKVSTSPGMNIGYLAFNTKHPVLGKVEVRQALDMAIDKATLVKTVFGDAGVQAQTLMPAANWANDPSIKGNAYNPDKARELLKKAGVSGLSISLWSMPVIRNYNPNSKLIAQLIQTDWAKVGVTANIVTYEWGEYLRRVDKGEHDTVLLGWNGDTEPANTAGQLGCGSASGTFWCNAEYEKLLAEARAGLTREARKAAYAKALRLATQQLPWSPLAHGAISVPHRASVKGFVLSLDSSLYFDGVLPR
jgi:ABC-type transport system substrate-binding protein